ncbi:importin [Rhodotorula toruloides]|uniref:Importin n=1 Tax=Rhodotorula toruloides TaxID=5286 RepID=A0A511KKM2_RHOTO|nr:importin [Rhodotorula toruloides]
MQVHPSRMQNVPDNDQPQSRPRASDYHSPPRHQTPPHLARRDDRDDRYGGDRRERRASPSYGEYNDPAARREREEQDHRREREAMRRDREAAEDDRERRAVEREYQRGGGRATPELELGHGPRAGRGGDSGYGGGRGYGGRPRPGGRDEFFEARRKERENSNVTIWPPSPRTPEPEDDGTKSRKSKSSHREHKSSSSRHHRSSRHKSRHSDDSSDSDDSDDDRRSKRHRSSRHSSSRHHRSRRSSQRDSSRRDKDDKSRSRTRSPRRSSKRSLSPVSDDDDARSSKRHERDPIPTSTAVAVASTAPGDTSRAAADDNDEWVEKSAQVDYDVSRSDDEVGPMPLSGPGAPKNRNAYGGALRPGEGTAMAAFVAEGQRIPRRGEIGLEADQIERYESAGFVMSGSRHKRMNAVRVRKENQVISAEEKRGILQLAAAEKAKRENEIVASFREMVDSKLQGGS